MESLTYLPKYLAYRLQYSIILYNIVFNIDIVYYYNKIIYNTNYCTTQIIGASKNLKTRDFVKL